MAKKGHGQRAATKRPSTLRFTDGLVSRVLGTKIRGALAQKASRGERVGAIPYGWRLGEDGVHLEPDEKEQAAIKNASQLRNRGATYRSIAVELDRRGHRSRMGRVFDPQQVRRMLAPEVRRGHPETDSTEVFAFDGLPPLFPWSGGKRNAAAEVWRRIGADVDVYWEPFAGAAAVLLARPGGSRGIEILNDKDGHITNLYRTVKHEAERLVDLAAWPVSQLDLRAQAAKMCLADGTLSQMLEQDAEYHDAELAGMFLRNVCGALQPVCYKDPSPAPKVGSPVGIYSRSGRRDAADLIRALRIRLASVQLPSQDWTKLAKQIKPRRKLVTGVFLDPPYKSTARVYRQQEVSESVQEWAIEHGKHPNMRIAICGRGKLLMPQGWSLYTWKGNQGKDRAQERIWFSPACLP